MVACGLEPARSLRKKDALAIRDAFGAGGFDEAAVARFIDEVVPFEYQADVRRMWDDDLGPEARVHLDSDDETRCWITCRKPAARAGRSAAETPTALAQETRQMSTEMQTVQTDHINFGTSTRVSTGPSRPRPCARSGSIGRSRARGRTRGFCQAHGGNALLFFRLPAVGQGQTGQKPPNGR